MTAEQTIRDPALIAASYQDHILPKVSRTFALTIPQLPHGLREAVGNAYLLCRLADTIEDEPALSPQSKREFQERFAALVVGEGDIEAFVAALLPQLSSASSPDEHELVRNAALVLRVTASFSATQRAAIARCLRIMCAGMHRFQFQATPSGLQDLAELDRYCYYVAGVVGEMLTELFCAHSPEIERRRDALMQRAVSFGQGLQMTNILKDVWDDLARGVCWLPRDVFARHGYDLGSLTPGRHEYEFRAAYNELIGVAHAHLRNALEYTLLLPAHEAGIRRFCAWAVGMAVLTLDKIHANLGFADGAEVKITRAAVGGTVLMTRFGIRSDGWLRWLFDSAAHDLPLTALAPGWDAFVATAAGDES